ncbi:hypothetical protein LINPERPRIM_LOCUS34135 [Linum perenne]
MVFLLLFLLCGDHVIHPSEAIRHLPEVISVHNKRINFTTLLLEEFRIKHISRKVKVMDSPTNRVSPGGPDPEHH